MVNSESLSDIFQVDANEDECSELVDRDGTITCKCLKRLGSSSSIDKSVQVNTDDFCDSSRFCIPDSEENANTTDENKLSSISITESGSSSFDLHLSPESEEYPEEPIPEPPSTNPNQRSSEDSCLNESLSSRLLPKKPAREIASSSGCKHSPDIFENSPEGLSTPDHFLESVPAKTMSTSPVEDGLTGDVLSQANNREAVEEWSSQDLSDVSKSLKIRRKQVKRLIAAVIRKRQMEDETLEAFKKRLKRF